MKLCLLDGPGWRRQHLLPVARVLVVNQPQHLSDSSIYLFSCSSHQHAALSVTGLACHVGLCEVMWGV